LFYGLYKFIILFIIGKLNIKRSKFSTLYNVVVSIMTSILLGLAGGTL